jgi:hypothetical protein
MAIDRLSTSGWDGQSLVVTLSRTSTPTKPIAGPTRSPAMIPAGYISGHTTPPLVPGNMAMPPSPVSPESVCHLPKYKISNKLISLAQIFQSPHSTISIPRVRRYDGTHTNATPRIYAYDARSTRTTNAMLPPIPSNERHNVRAALEHDPRLPDVPTTELPTLPPQLSLFLPRSTIHHNRELELDYYMRRSRNPSADSRHCPEMQHSHHGLGRWQWPAPRVDRNANSRRGPVCCDHVQ